MSSAILTANLPTLVPPNFWTSQRADGSMVFWWRFGGVRGREPESVEDGEAGTGSSDIGDDQPLQRQDF